MNPIIEFLKYIKLYGMEKMGRYYSSYRAFVIDNEDPDGLSRLILRIPDLTGININQKWAWPKGQFAGKDYGSQIIPQKGDLVWCQFEFGDPKRPIWENGYFAKGEKPEALKDIQNYWFKTPSGHLIELDDKNKELRITTVNGKTLIEKDGVWYFDGGDNKGLLKLSPTTEKLNNLENKVNEILVRLETHTHFATDMLTPLTGTPIPVPPLILPLTPTLEVELENNKVKH